MQFLLMFHAVYVCFFTYLKPLLYLCLSGGSGYESGGPGIMYFHSDTSRNLRVDNKCQKPTVRHVF